MFTRTKYCMCSCSEQLFEELICWLPLFGTHELFIIELSDYEELEDKEQIEVKHLYTK